MGWCLGAWDNCAGAHTIGKVVGWHAERLKLSSLVFMVSLVPLNSDAPRFMSAWGTLRATCRHLGKRAPGPVPRASCAPACPTLYHPQGPGRGPVLGRRWNKPAVFLTSRYAVCLRRCATSRAGPSTSTEQGCGRHVLQRSDSRVASRQNAPAQYFFCICSRTFSAKCKGFHEMIAICMFGCLHPFVSACFPELVRVLDVCGIFWFKRAGQTEWAAREPAWLIRSQNCIVPDAYQQFSPRVRPMATLGAGEL